LDVRAPANARFRASITGLKLNARLKPQVSIEREPFTDSLCAELLPLAEENWVRSESYIGDLPLDPDIAKYKSLEKMGMMDCLIARRAGAVVGYVIMFTSMSFHHRQARCTHGDIIFVKSDPGLEYLAGGLLRASERILIERGVNFVGWFVHKDSKIERLLTSFGYTADEHVMEKRLCALSVTH
jgi:hypothetical protein